MNCTMRKCIIEHPYKTALCLFLLIVLGLGLYSAYKSYRNIQSMQLAQKYFGLSSAMQTLSSDQNKLESLVKEIDGIKKDSAYSNMAHLLMAKYYFEHKQYDKSVDTLKFILKNYASDDMLVLAYVRLVNVYIAKNDFASAQKIVLDKSLTGNIVLAPAIYEVKGDMYLAQKNYTQAISSYKQVLKLDVSDDVKRGAKVKLQLLGVST
jgi:predicted negative regulator of RcsB-dependent stress response